MDGAVTQAPPMDLPTKLLADDLVMFVDDIEDLIR
jgi:hypothetical protein